MESPAKPGNAPFTPVEALQEIERTLDRLDRDALTMTLPILPKLEIYYRYKRGLAERLKAFNETGKDPLMRSYE